MMPSMRPYRSSRWPSALILPVALWSAVPGVQWCPLGWAEVPPECFVACVSPATILNVGSPGCCEESCGAVASCPPRETCGAEESGPLEGTNPDAPYPGGRAFCLSGPSGGEGVPRGAEVAPDSPGRVAVLPPVILGADLPKRSTFPVVGALPHPPPAPTGAVPRGRAPPGFGGTTC